MPWAIRKVGVGNIEPGDVIAHNDPQVGAPHLPEFCVIRPIFEGDRIVMHAATIAHQTDIGGKSAGSMPGDARDIFQEGLLVPPLKLFERGVESEPVFRMLLANVRAPQPRRTASEENGCALALQKGMMKRKFEHRLQKSAHCGINVT